MYFDFDKLPGDAKIWIYPFERELEETEVHEMKERAKEFCASWKSHGLPVKSSVSVMYNRFIVLAADATSDDLCGRAVDESVRFMKELGKMFNLDLLRRDIAFFFDPHDNTVKSMPLLIAKERIRKGEIDRLDLFLNTLVLKKADLEQNWIIPAGESWLRNLFPETTGKIPSGRSVLRTDRKI